MQRPEVVNFPPPPSSLQCKTSNLKKHPDQCRNVIAKHYFNHKVSVILPDTLFVPDQLKCALVEDCEYYLVNDLCLSEIVITEFIEAFVRNGRLTALSIGTSIDTEDCAAILPSGHLYLSLTKDTYEELGLQGKPSFFNRGKPHKPWKYVVTVDLRADHFTPEKKNYKRVKWCFNSRLQLKFTFLMSWEPPREDVCPSSVAAYLQTRGQLVSECHPWYFQQTNYNMTIPLLSAEEEDFGSGYEELIEWLGLYCLGAKLERDLEDTHEDYLSTYQVPEPHGLFGQVKRLEWTGFFNTTQISHLFSSLRAFMQERENLPWVNLTVHGFDDSPVSWGGREHSFHSHGDNLYTVFLMPGEDYLMSTVTASSKRVK